MTASLQQAKFWIRDDLTMMIEIGNVQEELHFDADKAYEFVWKILDRISALRPWRGNADEEIANHVHGLAMEAAVLAAWMINHRITDENRQFLTLALESAFCQLATLRQVTLLDDHNAKHPM